MKLLYAMILFCAMSNSVVLAGNNFSFQKGLNADGRASDFRACIISSYVYFLNTNKNASDDQNVTEAINWCKEAEVLYLQALEAEFFEEPPKVVSEFKRLIRRQLLDATE